MGSCLKFSITDSQNVGFEQCKEVHGVRQDVREHAGPVDARAHPQPLPQVQVGQSPPRKPLAGFAGRHSLDPGCSRGTSDPTLGTNPLDVPTVESPLQIGDLPILHRNPSHQSSMQVKSSGSHANPFFIQELQVQTLRQVFCSQELPEQTLRVGLLQRPGDTILKCPNKTYFSRFHPPSTTPQYQPAPPRLVSPSPPTPVFPMSSTSQPQYSHTSSFL